MALFNLHFSLHWVRDVVGLVDKIDVLLDLLVADEGGFFLLDALAHNSGLFAVGLSEGIADRAGLVFGFADIFWLGWNGVFLFAGDHCFLFIVAEFGVGLSDVLIKILDEYFDGSDGGLPTSFFGISSVGIYVVLNLLRSTWDNFLMH